MKNATLKLVVILYPNLATSANATARPSCDRRKFVIVKLHVSRNFHTFDHNASLRVDA